MTISATPTTDPATGAPPRQHTPSRWWIAAVLAALAFVAATVTVFVTQMGGTQQGAAPAAAPSRSPGVFPDEQAMTGDELLTAMADQVALMPAEVRTGSYELMHTVIFNPEIQGPVYHVEAQTWRLPDGTARYAVQRSRTLPAQGFDPMTAGLDVTGKGVRQIIQDSTIDTDLVDFPNIVLPAGGDPTAQLNWYLDTQRRGQTASSRVRIQELVSIYHSQLVPAILRAAILRLLAQLPEITFTHQRTTDPLHRDGIAFHTSFGDAELELIVDPISGALHAVHERFHGRLFAYTVFYPGQWADQRGPTHPQPTPISTIGPTGTPAPRP